MRKKKENSIRFFISDRFRNTKIHSAHFSLLLLFFLILNFSSSLFAGGEVSTGSFLSFKDSNRFEPTYLYLDGFGHHEIDSLLLSGKGEVLYGFPDELNKSPYGFNSYGSLYLRGHAEYKHKYFTLGAITNWYQSPESSSRNREVVSRDVVGRKTYSVNQEFYGFTDLLDAVRIRFLGGFQHQKFDVENDEMEPKDSNFYIEPEISLTLFDFARPYIGYYYYNDIEEETSIYSHSGLHAGVRGDLYHNSKFHLFYDASYSYLDSGSEEIANGKTLKFINEPHRLSAYVRMRLFLTDRDELFIWGKHEYSIDDADKFRYVNRNMTIMARHWFIPSDLSLSAGTTLQFELTNQSEKLYVPTWPFAELFYRFSDFELRAKYLMKFDRAFEDQDAEKRSYLASAQKMKIGLAYTWDFLKPSIYFFYNDLLNSDRNGSNVDSLGTRLEIAAIF